MRRSGRRPGNQDTREEILAAAREAFAEKGFDKASIRAIATAAEVDPALVHHYFGAKDKLFLAAMAIPLDPAELVPQALDGPREEAGERMVRLLLSVWDSPAGAAAVAILRSAMSNEWTARLLREFIITKVLRSAILELGIPADEAPMRAGLVATQIGGLAMARYVLKVEPITSAEPETLVKLIGPNIQRYLVEKL